MFIVTLNKNKPIILIDASYYVFYRYFATTKWYNIQKKTFTEAEFNKSFLSHVESDIKKIIKKWKTVTTNIIYCIDCGRSKIWRNEYFKEYKSSRVLNNNFNQNIFNVFYNHIFQNRYNSINLDKLEADDIVYLTHYNIYNSFDKIIIITNDNDYLQLIDEKTDVVNMQFKNIKFRTNLSTAKSNLIYKTLLGDKSDNIPKISTTINKELALKLCNDEILLEEWLEKNNMNDNYNFNLKLISFEYIPDELKEKFRQNYSFIYE